MNEQNSLRQRKMEISRIAPAVISQRHHEFGLKKRVMTADQKKQLQQFYDQRVSTSKAGDFLSHVGHTERGEPISQAHLNLMFEHIKSGLDLDARDSVLELCCGNGLFSATLCKSVRNLVGIDFSEALVSVANQYHSAPNVSYLLGDVAKLSEIDGLRGEKFSKVFMNASLQHFKPSAMKTLLEELSPFLADDAKILLSCVPLAGKQSVLFGTLVKRLQRIYLKITKQDIFGYWWSLDDIEVPARNRNFQVSILAIPKELFFSKYRFSALLSRGF